MKAPLTCACLGLLALLALGQPAAAKDVVVGGSSGWTLGVKYSPIEAQVGDVLVFNWRPGAHDVWQLPAAECNFQTAGAAQLADASQGTLRQTLSEEGTFYFACSINGEHCTLGMLVTVKVTAGAKAPAAAPTPAPTGPATCSPAIKALLQSAEPDFDGGSIAWATTANYSSGTVRTYTTFLDGEKACSVPKAMGVEVSFDALANLPSASKVENQPPPFCNSDPTAEGCFLPFDALFLPFFPEVGSSFNAFPLLEFDWQPLGHPPEGVYLGSPHLDIHFYLVDTESILNITAGPCNSLTPEAFNLANQPIPKGCFPPGFTNIAETAPVMGNHYVNLTAPELAALALNQSGLDKWNATWIWGGFGGQITYFEIMVKRTYLEAEPEFCAPIPGYPSEFAIAGAKPKTYCLSTVPNGVRIELRDFAMYEAGCKKGPMDPASYAAPSLGAPPLPDVCVVPKA